MRVDGEQPFLDQVGLGRLTHADRGVGLSHAEVEFLVIADDRQIDLRVMIGKTAYPRRQPGRGSSRGDFAPEFNADSRSHDRQEDQRQGECHGTTRHRW